jgi:protein involved in polysaccharide export with SLBB domain
MLLASGAAAQELPVQPPVPVPQAAAALDTTYRLRAGDQVRVVVFFHPDLTQELPIRPDGRITFPIAGDLPAAGRTPEELGKDLTERLERVLRNAEASVLVQRFADLRVYVGGEVNNAGVYPLTAPLTTLQAMLQAGGARKTASLSNVFVIRNENGAPRIMKLDLRQSTLEAIGSRDDIALEPLDIVFVPKTRIAHVNDFVEQYITKVLPLTVFLGLNYNFGGFLHAGGG